MHLCVRVCALRVSAPCRVRQAALRSCYSRYGGDRCEWLLAKPRFGGPTGVLPSSADPAQVALFVAAAKFTEDVEAALQRVAAGHGNALVVCAPAMVLCVRIQLNLRVCVCLCGCRSWLQ